MLVVAVLYYYIAIPAINIHSSEFWIFIFAFVVILAVWYAWKKKIGRAELRQSKIMKMFGIALLVLVVVYAVGTLLSSPIIDRKSTRLNSSHRL